MKGAVSQAARPVALLLALATASLGAACGGTYQVDASSPPIARVWRARCGACHTPVEPRSRSREEATTALLRHRKRVALSEDQWAAMVDFVGGPATSLAAPHEPADGGALDTTPAPGRDADASAAPPERP